MSGLPWGKFFWKDWLTDPALSVCSLAAQGLWMRMLCIMSMSEPPGYFTLPPSRGKPVSEAKQVARMCLADARLVRVLLDELETRRVFSRDESGIIVSRRMVRDAELSALGRDAANRGWQRRKGKPKGVANGQHPDRASTGPGDRDLPADLPPDGETESPPVRPRRLRSRRSKGGGWTDIAGEPH